MPRYDVAVIGGGLIGTAAAFYLARAGARVVCLERDQLNLGASGRNAGSLHFQLEHRHIVHAEHLEASLPALVALSGVAMADWRGLEEALGAPLALSMAGGLVLAETGAELALLERKCRIENAHGLDTRLLDGDEARSLAPALGPAVRGAAFCPGEGHCDPRAVTLACAQAAQAAGAEIRTGQRVLALEREPAAWRVACRAAPGREHAELRAGSVLNAAGAAAAEIAALAGIHLPVFAVGLSMCVTEPIGPLLGHLVQHVGRQLSMNQVAAGNALIGGGWPAPLRAAPDGGLRAVPAMSTVRENLRAAVAVVPTLRSVHLLRTWGGVTGVTADQLPLLGEVPRSRGFFVAAGGSGFTFGPTYARLLSEQITTGRSTPSLAPYSPARFDHINMFMRGAMA